MIETVLTHDPVRHSTPSLEWLRSPAKPALQVASALDRLRRAPAILPAMRTLPDLLRVVEEAVEDGIATRALLEPILEAIADDHDSITGLAATHALGRIPGVLADDALATLLLDAAPGFEEHVTWGLTDRAASPGLTRPLARTVARGGLSGMHAQRALARWSGTDADLVLVALESVLRETWSPNARRRVVETLGLVPGRMAGQALEHIALDAMESDQVRVTAIAAFAERTDERLPSTIGRLASSGDELGEAVRMTRAHRQMMVRGPRRDRGRDAGLRVAQIHLGEVGGLATLLPQLGRVLSDQGRIAETVTIVRSGRDGTTVIGRPGAAHRLETVNLVDGEGVSFTSSWPGIIAASRAIRSAFLAGPLPDVLHLRMADPGSFAGAAVARELGIPIVFTLAPDPHGPITAAEASGVLDRRNFAHEDARSALWFRATLVERLARDAQELVLFPRTALPEQIKSLTGVDVHTGRPRHTVVPEGIDTALADEASQTISAAITVPPVIGDLERAISALPRDRHGLPLVVSAGRLHELKGMARLVEAFARDQQLSGRANLVIVGGDLERPSALEAAELARIDRLMKRYPGLDSRVVMLGRRAHQEVALVLATARAGWGKLVAAGGAYACGSRKEEFGLAIVEAMAAGLPVAAPRDGGPSTYVVDGITGVLVDTTDIDAVAIAIGGTLDLAHDPETAARTRRVVDDRFTLERMARTLAAVYRISTGPTTLGLPVKTQTDPAA